MSPATEVIIMTPTRRAIALIAEIDRGWFARREFGVGDSVRLSPSVGK